MLCLQTMTQLINVFLSLLIGISYVTLGYFVKDINQLWFGMNEIGIPTAILLVPIILSTVSMLNLLVFTYSESNESHENTLTAIFSFVLVWAPLLWMSIKQWYWAKYAVIGSLFGVTISSTILLSFLVRDNAPVTAILAAAFVFFQSVIDSTIWSYLFFKNT